MSILAALASLAVALALGPNAVFDAEEAGFRSMLLDWRLGGSLGLWLPFHVVLAVGLWRGGVALGGTAGGAWALAAGLSAPGVVASAHTLSPVFPATALAAVATASALERRWILAIVATIPLVALGPRFDPALREVYAASQPAIVIAVVIALLGTEPRVIALLGAAVTMSVVLPGGSTGAVAVLAVAGAAGIAGAGIAGSGIAGAGGVGTRARLVGLLAIAAGQWAFAAPRVSPPWTTADLDRAIDWLEAAGGGRVAVDLDPPLTPALLALKARERGAELTFVPPGPADLGLAIALAPSPWRSMLPLETEGWTSTAGATVRLWDRALPAESELKAGTERGHFPARQALYARMPDGTVTGPLLAPASSAEVVRRVDADGGVEWLVFYVRDQQVWRARSDDGLGWDAAAPVGIAGFDPAPVALGSPGERWRLYVAELTGGPADVDPAIHPTRIVSYRSDDLLHFEREEGVRAAGLGLVDPAARRTPAGWELYYTVARRDVRRSLSADGLAFSPDPSFTLAGSTVPFVHGDRLIAQRPAMRETLLYAWPLDGGPGRPAPLEICGTGASVAGDRVYFTRDSTEPPCTLTRPGRRLPW